MLYFEQNGNLTHCQLQLLLLSQLFKLIVNSQDINTFDRKQLNILRKPPSSAIIPPSRRILNHHHHRHTTHHPYHAGSLGLSPQL
ncbi:hypothetical protein J4Q44_G00278060 [Coregonus suidteri]|uniref:Uncharacterized protein n=1 Tax=Coregonus suidteri TaxID=861788 RepID=A0AAN8L1G3_9TELE